jgi:hypothetical protein
MKSKKKFNSKYPAKSIKQIALAKFIFGVNMGWITSEEEARIRARDPRANASK